MILFALTLPHLPVLKFHKLCFELFVLSLISDVILVW